MAQIDERTLKCQLLTQAAGTLALTIKDRGRSGWFVGIALIQAHGLVLRVEDIAECPLQRLIGSVLDKAGYRDSSKRFWIDAEFPEAATLFAVIKTKFDSLGLEEESSEATLGKLEKYAP